MNFRPQVDAVVRLAPPIARCIGCGSIVSAEHVVWCGALDPAGCTLLLLPHCRTCAGKDPARKEAP